MLRLEITGRRKKGDASAVALYRRGLAEIGAEVALRLDAELFEISMVGFHRLDGIDHAVGDAAEVLDERERVLGEVDLASEQGDARAVFLRVVDELEGVERGARAAPENADDDIGIIGNEFLERAGAVVGDFEKERTSGAGHAGEGAHDVVVKKGGDGAVGNGGIDVGVEDFEEVAEVLQLGLVAEGVEVFERVVVPVDVVGESDRIKAEVGARAGGGVIARFAGARKASVFDVINRRGTKRTRGMRGVFATSHSPYVGGVIGARSGRDQGVLKKTLGHAEPLKVRCGKKHDVHDVLPDDFADLLAVIGKRFPTRSG